MITFNRTLTVSKNTASLNEPLYMFRGDGNILIILDLIRTIRNMKFGKVSSTNVITDGLIYSTVCIYKPSGDLAFVTKGEIVGDQMQVTLLKDVMDEVTEIGEHKLQIHLFDEDENRLTLPEVGQIYIAEPLCENSHFDPIDTTAIVGSSTVGTCVVADDPAILADEYLTYDWQTGEYITAAKLNNMIMGIDKALSGVNININIKVNGNTYEHNNGTITLPDYPSLNGYATETYVKNQIASAQLGGDGHEVALSVGNVYCINLEDWGIQNGFLDDREYVLNGGIYNPKYTDEEYLIAHNNKEGLNNALKFAADNGFTVAMLPSNSEIFICYEEPNTTVNAYYLYTKDHIMIPNNLTFDMNFSTIKVIYDSENTNPYDLSIHDDNNPVFKLHGHLISFHGCKYSGIKNGTLIGTKKERLFNDTYTGYNKEEGFDFGCGISVSKGASFITIENMDIKGFMADGIAGMSYHNEEDGTTIYNPAFSANGYINNQGALTALDGAYSTDFLDISSWRVREGVMTTNIGYTIVPDTHNQDFVISFYDTNKTYMMQNKVRYLQNIIIPENAKYMRISILLEETGLALGFKKNFQIVPNPGEFLNIIRCEIHENHRGGISNILNDTIIEKCKIYNNGRGEFENLPVFFDTTRYGVNCEDCSPRKLTIKDCYFFDCFHAILFAGGTINVENNIFFNLGGATLKIYNCENAFFERNVVINGGEMLADLTSVYKNRTLIIKDNKFINSNLALPTGIVDTDVQIIGNSLKGACDIFVPENAICRDNIWNYYKRDNHTYELINTTLNNCDNFYINLYEALFSTAWIKLITTKNSKNIIINNKSDSGDPKIMHDVFYNVTFNKCTNINPIVVTDTDATNYSYMFDNCKLNESKITLGGYTNTDQNLIMKIKDTVFNNTTIDTFVNMVWYANTNNKTFDVEFDSCEFNTSAANFAGIFNAALSAVFKGNIIFRNCNFINSGENVAYLFKATANAGSSLNIKVLESTFSGSWVYSTAAVGLVNCYSNSTLETANSTACVTNVTVITNGGTTSPGGSFSGSYNDLTDKPTIPTDLSLSGTTLQLKNTGGIIGSGVTLPTSSSDSGGTSATDTEVNAILINIFGGGYIG